MLRKKAFCKAPFINMYIDEEGNVTPCCFNRNDVLGNIFQQEIEEIWNSSKAQELRDLFNKNQFPVNCKICKNSIESGNYYNSGIFTYSKFNSKKLTIQSIDFELSYKCNLSCVMCNLHSSKYNITSEAENIILSKLKPVFKFIKRAQFYGGEPLIIPVYYKILTEIIKQNTKCNILIQTNGTIINDEIINLAKKGRIIFNVSLDAVNPNLLSKIRKGSNWNKIYENIQTFKKLSKKRITLAITPMLYNWKEIPKIIHFANKNKFQIFFNNMIQPRNMALWYLPPNEIKDTISYYKKKNRFSFNLVSFINHIRFKHFIKNLEKYYCDALKRPNYSQEDLFKYSENVYQIIIEKLPQFQTYPKQTLILKISEFLYLHNYDEAKEFIKTKPHNDLEKIILSFLNNEQ